MQLRHRRWGHPTTTLNDRPVRLRACGRIEDATLLVGDLFNPASIQDELTFDALLPRAKMVRTWGSCCSYLLIATGLQADVMMDPIARPPGHPGAGAQSSTGRRRDRDGLGGRRPREVRLARGGRAGHPRVIKNFRA